MTHDALQLAQVRRNARGDWNLNVSMLRWIKRCSSIIVSKLVQSRMNLPLQTTAEVQMFNVCPSCSRHAFLDMLSVSKTCSFGSWTFTNQAMKSQFRVPWMLDCKLKGGKLQKLSESWPSLFLRLQWDTFWRKLQLRPPHIQWHLRTGTGCLLIQYPFYPNWLWRL